MLPHLLLVGLLACSGRSGPVPEPPDYAPTGVRWSALHGVPPEQGGAMPSFEAHAQDGSVRTDADLQGRPTALWFYPAAATPG